MGSISKQQNSDTESEELSEKNETIDELDENQNINNENELNSLENNNEMESSADESDDEEDVEEGAEEDVEEVSSKVNQNDPFSTHFDKELDSSDIEILSKNENKSTLDMEWPKIGKLVQINNENTKYNCDKLVSIQNIERFYLKNIIIENLSKAVLTSDRSCQSLQLSSFQCELFSVISLYRDLLFTERNFSNGEEIRLIYCIHALNHVLKTRSRILHHNYKIRQHVSSEEEYRDQGLTRPKVLILVPFRDSVLRIVRILTALMFGDTKDNSEKKRNVMNIKRFIEEFSPEEETIKSHNKPEDYESTFDGNIDDSFRIGISVTKKSLKLYSDFYSSDIIIASPLGLRIIIGAEGDQERDFDFLSSIEVLIMDQTDIFLMQNWEHILHIMKHLHLQPTDARGVDFSRVRMWILEGWTKFYCQLLLFSSVTVPSITSFFNKFSSNFSGKVIVRNEITPEKAAVNSVYVQCPQIFNRFNCSSLALTSDERFKFFVSTILPKFKDKLMSRTMIYIQSYFDFVRLRNYFRKEEINFTQVCEYTKDGKVAKARSLFFNGARDFMLYTERFHFFHRYRIKGIRHLIFYEMPTYPHFYSEILNFMHISMQGKKFVGDYSSMSCTVIYNKYDALQLAAIVGNNKASQMLRSNTSVHMFVTENK